MRNREQIREQMDAAAKQAEEEFGKLFDEHPEAVRTVGEWWQEWYLRAGHKRLGRILVRYTKALAKEE